MNYFLQSPIKRLLKQLLVKCDFKFTKHTLHKAFMKTKAFLKLY